MASHISPHEAMPLSPVGGPGHDSGPHSLKSETPTSIQPVPPNSQSGCSVDEPIVIPDDDSDEEFDDIDASDDDLDYIDLTDPATRRRLLLSPPNTNAAAALDQTAESPRQAFEHGVPAPGSFARSSEDAPPAQGQQMPVAVVPREAPPCAPVLATSAVQASSVGKDSQPSLSPPPSRPSRSPGLVSAQNMDASVTVGHTATAALDPSPSPRPELSTPSTSKVPTGATSQPSAPSPTCSAADLSLIDADVSDPTQHSSSMVRSRASGASGLPSTRLDSAQQGGHLVACSPASGRAADWENFGFRGAPSGRPINRPPSRQSSTSGRLGHSSLLPGFDSPTLTTARDDPDNYSSGDGCCVQSNMTSTSHRRGRISRRDKRRSPSHSTSTTDQEDDDTSESVNSSCMPSSQARRRRRSDTSDDDMYSPTQDSTSEQDEHMRPQRRKRRKTTPGTATSPRSTADEQPQSDRPARLKQHEASAKGQCERLGMDTPPPSQDSGGENCCKEPADFTEWPLTDAVLKCVSISGRTVFQLQFSRDSCAEHGQASTPPQKSLIKTRPSGGPGQARKRSAFTPEEDRLLSELKRKGELKWEEIHSRFSDSFPGRSLGALQVRYCTKLNRKPRKISR